MDYFNEAFVISGGSTGGFAMLGKLHQLKLTGEFNQKTLRTFGGTSVGALISILLGLKMTPEEIFLYLYENTIWEKFCKKNLMDGILGKGFYKIDLIKKELEKLLEEKFGVKYFKDLNFNFVCAAYNYTGRVMKYFNTRDDREVKIVDALFSSCAIPFLFEPIFVNGELYIDGGIVDNCPIEKTIELFKPEKITILTVEKTDSEIIVSNYAWSFNDVWKIFFAGCDYNFTKQRINTLDNNCIHKKVGVEQKFYKLELNKQKMLNLYLQGLVCQKT